MSWIKKNWEKFKIWMTPIIKNILAKLKVLFLKNWLVVINYSVILVSFLIVSMGVVKIILGGWLVFSILYLIYLWAMSSNKKAT